MVVSSDPDASIRPSGDHAMRPIRPLCPRSERTSFTPSGRLGTKPLDFFEFSFHFFLAIISNLVLSLSTLLLLKRHDRRARAAFIRRRSVKPLDVSVAGQKLGDSSSQRALAV